jgi:DNA (cytosine-5)-methyltransferase 1
VVKHTGHLFAGAGGGLYADLILGHEPVFAVEWERYPAERIAERFPDLHMHIGDIRLFDSSAWAGRVDSIHAGFPCQDISVAGVGSGIDGDRSGLWSEVVRCADAIRPGELFLENSPAIVSRGLDRVLSDLAALGFDAEWCCLPAAGVGAPHRRDRWWCLARRADGDGMRKLQPERAEQNQRRRVGDLGKKQSKSASLDRKADQTQKPVADTNSEFVRKLSGWQRRQKRAEKPAKSGNNGETGWWSTEPGVGRVANGVANRVNRIKALGNGQVPLQAAAAYVLLDARY